MEVQSKVMNLDNISTDLQSTDEDTVKDALIALNGFQNIEVEKVCLQSSRYFKLIYTNISAIRKRNMKIQNVHNATTFK